VTTSLSKLTALEAALEYLIKATPGESLEYLTPGEPAPGDTRILTGSRGGRGYYPSEVAVAEEEVEAPSELEPEEEREVEVVQAPEAKPESSSDVKPRKKAQLAPPIPETWTSVGHKIVQRGVRPALARIFHKGFKVSDFQDMYSTGLEDFSTIIEDIRPYDAAFTSELSDIEGAVTIKKGIRIRVDIKDDSGQLAGSMTRSFKRVNGELRVNHHSFMINRLYQGKGIATDINEHVEKEYEKLGVYSIILNANVDIGGYTWARQGYDFIPTAGPQGGLRKMKERFIDQISRLSSLPVFVTKGALVGKLVELAYSGDLQAVFEELYPDKDWSELKSVEDNRLEGLLGLENPDKWRDLLEKIEDIRPPQFAPRISAEDSVRAEEQISKFKHAWEFASWHLNGEHLGKEFMLGSNWNGKKILDKESKGYQIGKEYFAEKRNTSVTG
jgi:hypothetical protein